MNTVYLTRPVLRILAVVGFVLLLALVVWMLAGLPAPRERDRVSTTDGSFSVIKPPDWESRVSYNFIFGSTFTSTIEITPVKSVGRMQRFCASQFRAPPTEQTLAGFTPTRFQNDHAWIHIHQAKRDFSFRLIFQRGEKWYEMSLRLPAPDDVPNSDWWPYFNSFRAQAGPATRTVDSATSQPQ
jgi:hypothetical protein